MGVSDGDVVSFDDLKELSAHGPRTVTSCAALLAALGVPSDASPQQVWRTAEARLKAYATQLDSELRMAFIEGMGLRQGAPQSSVERLRIIAHRIDRVERTARNDDHTFVISIQLPRHEAMVPMVGLYPVSPTTKFKASVRFGSRRPTSVERFEGAIPVGTFPPVTQIFNPAVRYHESTFTAPRIGLGYGIKWGWD